METRKPCCITLRQRLGFDFMYRVFKSSFACNNIFYSESLFTVVKPLWILDWSYKIVIESKQTTIGLSPAQG